MIHEFPPGVELALLAALGMGVGALAVLLGAGGGFALVPILALAYPADEPDRITAASLVVVLVTALSGSAVYARLRQIDYRAAAAFASASAPAAALGAWASSRLPRSAFDLALGLVVIGVAGVLAVGLRRGLDHLRRHTPGDQGPPPRTSPGRLALGSAACAVIAFFSAVLGIGGGLFRTPTILAIVRVPVRVAVATSLLVLLVGAAAALAAHAANGSLDGAALVRAGPIALGAIVGSQVGARLSGRVPAPALVALLAAALALMGARMLLKGLHIAQ